METTTVSTKKPSSMIEKLRAEAKSNKCFNAICHVFALRERARQQVTFETLKATLTKEGFTFTDAQYQHVLKFMGTLHIGTIERDAKGRIKALKNIRYKLQSLGKAAIDENATTESFAPRNQFSEVPVVPPKAPPVNEVAKQDEPQLMNFQREVPQDAIKLTPGPGVQNVALTASINGMPVVFVIADELPTAALGKLLMKLSDKQLLLE